MATFGQITSTVDDSSSTGVDALSAIHVPALDGIRGVAILLVLTVHLAETFQASIGIWARRLLIGRLGVNLFFVLSGFLITGILVDTKPRPNYLRAFYAKRVLRIFPLYYAVLSLASILYVIGWLRPLLPHQTSWILYWTYLQNWRPLIGTNTIDHFWSLAVEEQFYLIWPYCVMVLSNKRLAQLASLGIFIAFSLRWVLYVRFGANQFCYQATVCRMDDLLFGALGALLVRDDHAISVFSNRRNLLLVSACTLASSIYLVGSGGLYWNSGVKQVSIPLAALWSLVFTSCGYLFSLTLVDVFLRRHTLSITQRFLQSHHLRSVGKYSYSLYVLHLPIFVLLRLMFPLHGWLYFGLAVWLSLLAAIGSYELYERRFLAFKRYIAT